MAPLWPLGARADTAQYYHLLPPSVAGQAEQLHAGPQRARRLSVGFSTLQRPCGQLGPRVPSHSCGRTQQCWTSARPQTLFISRVLRYSGLCPAPLLADVSPAKPPGSGEGPALLSSSPKLLPPPSLLSALASSCRRVSVVIYVGLKCIYFCTSLYLSIQPRDLVAEAAYAHCHLR